MATYERSEKLLRVHVESLVAGIDGSEPLMTNESATIGSLINGFILERRLRPEIASEFCLQDSKGNVLKSHRTVASYAFREDERIYLAKNASRILFGCRNWFALATGAFIAALIGYAVLIYLYARSGSIPFDYVVVIDAGSTHSELYVYQWKGLKDRGTGVVEQRASSRCDGQGLSSYASPQDAAQSLQNCLNYATQQIPIESWDSTEVHLGATAGMRLLQAEKPELATAIMSAVRTRVNGNFRFMYHDQNVRILTGIEEGVFGWIAANYLAKVLRPEQKSSYGALDLGGASNQITFESATSNSTAVTTLFGKQYNLYSHSYLCYGMREAERQLKALLIQDQTTSSIIQNPCGPLGNETSEKKSDIFGHFCTASFSQGSFDTYIFNGTSDSVACGATVNRLFDKSLCPFKDGHCSFDAVYQPWLTGDFMAFSGYYNIMEFLNLTRTGQETVSLAVFRDEILKFCSKTWQEIDVLNATDPNSPYLTQYCFDSHFIDSLLTKGLNFDDTSFGNIHFKRNIDNSDVTWTLGLALNSSNTRDNEKAIFLVSTPVFISLMVVFTLLFIFSLAFCVRAVRAARRHRDYEPLSTYGAI